MRLRAQLLLRAPYIPHDPSLHFCDLSTFSPLLSAWHRSSVYVVFLWFGGASIVVTTECGPFSLPKSNFVRSTWMLSHWYADAGSGASSSDTSSAASARPGDVPAHFIFRLRCVVSCRLGGREREGERGRQAAVQNGKNERRELLQTSSRRKPGTVLGPVELAARAR